MRAVTISGYGGLDRLSLTEADVPATGESDVLVKVMASSINPLDWKLRKGKLRLVWPLKFPFTLGFDVAGMVHAVGSQVTGWNVGDAIFATSKAGGAFADFVRLSAAIVGRKPEQLSFEQAAVMPAAGLSALQALRDLGGMKDGFEVLINGATGGVGHLALQIAKAHCCQVSAVTSTKNIELAEALGADFVIDYTKEPVLQDRRYDIIFDVVPNLDFFHCANSLKKNGTYVTTLPGPGPMAAMAWNSLRSVSGYQKRCRALMLRPNGADLEYLASLVADGRLTPLIEHTFDLESIREATQQSESGHTRGKIAVRISES